MEESLGNRDKGVMGPEDGQPHLFLNFKPVQFFSVPVSSTLLVS